MFQRIVYWVIVWYGNYAFFIKIFKQEERHQVVGRYSLQRKAIYGNYYLGVFFLSLSHLVDYVQCFTVIIAPIVVCSLTCSGINTFWCNEFRTLKLLAYLWNTDLHHHTSVTSEVKSMIYVSKICKFFPICSFLSKIEYSVSFYCVFIVYLLCIHDTVYLYWLPKVK